MSSERTFRPDVEGLRAVAVALVVLCHAAVPGMAGGYIGVDVFFVLSGFLITGLLIRERERSGSTSMLAFYARRARRILPAASLVLVFTVLASYQWLGFLRGGVIAEDGKWTALFAANLHFAREGTQYLNIAAPPSPLQHYWSLAVEEQFYLVWPALFLVVARVAPGVSLARKLSAVLVLIVAASFTWSIVQTETNATWAFFSPLTRAWELATGALLAVCLPYIRRVPKGAGPWLSWSGLAVILGGAAVIDANTAFPGYAAALPVAGTAFAVAGGTIAPRSGAERLLGLAPFQVLGKWSYSLYLWHWPILIIAAQRAGRDLSLQENLGLVALSVAVSAVAHHAIENPIRYARPLTRHSWASVAAGTGLVVAAYGVCAWQLQGHLPESGPIRAAHALEEGQPTNPGVWEKDALSDVLELVAEAPAATKLPDDLAPDLRAAKMDFAWLPPWGEGCLVDPDKLVSPPCVFGDPEGSRTVVLLGDSHAAQWIRAFDEIGRNLRWKVVLLTKTGCPAVSIEVNRAYGTGPQKLYHAYPECGQWLTYAIGRINEMSPDAVILASCNGCDYMVDDDGELFTREDWGAGLEETLRRITPAQTQKVVLGDIPRWWGTLDCLAVNQNDVQACAKPARTVIGVTYNDAERMAAAAAGVPFVDVTPWFCSAVCTAVIGNMVAYTNDYHVTATYADYLTGTLEAVLRPLVEDE